MNEKDVSLYKQEIDELTVLLNTEWSDLKGLLNHAGIKTEGGRLVSYFEDEEDNQYGVFITDVNQIVKFEIKEDIVEKEFIEDIDSIEYEYPQVIVALRY